MNLSTSTETTSLRINKVTREIYDYLRTSGLIEEDQIYCVEDTFLDAHNNPVIYVGDPISASDAANKGYVDSADGYLLQRVEGNTVDIRDTYPKGDTYSKTQVDDTLRNLSSTFYTKGVVDDIISSHVTYRIRSHSETEGNVYLYNMCTNVIRPESAISLVFPQQIVGSELTRSFMVVLDEPLSAVDVSFVGSDGEYLRFKGFENNSEMTADGTYTMFFDEISSSVFQTGIKKVVDISSTTPSPVEYEGTNVYVRDCGINTYHLTSDTNFIFPPSVSDDISVRIPRTFELYVIQDTVSAYGVQFSGFDGEDISLKTIDGQDLQDLELSGEYVFLVTELSDCGSVFCIGQKRTQDVEM